ncbi:hypothetical protein, partial [Providencia stuartii]|uniref:hypothetical protein n=1 Tax=Providencia stuartii TaxID=588 RepID=UPI0019532574
SASHYVRHFVFVSLDESDARPSFCCSMYCSEDAAFQSCAMETRHTGHTKVAESRTYSSEHIRSGRYTLSRTLLFCGYPGNRIAVTWPLKCS